ncbi:class I SAM-dependent methyltransferase [Rossellomorea sp. SC111]|uniref:class I SAM-dependent methyltransferase n=1 Tax=Rossellomorea sp. SC111 TaxID=2968985 RepID=UPI00215A90AD|nr:class I SAM-dependent methyltransferase [Rossellomorea sp. SC111]MCR8850332.1 class I SAM-dependent methyltransferase [Rossellomorea sp. SC111]
MKQNIYDNPTFFEGYMKLRDSKMTYNDFLEQPAMKDALPDLKGKRVMDLGCGTGGLSKYCIEMGASAVVGVDISEKMISRALVENNDENIKYVCSPIEDLSYPIEPFDLIVSSLAIHYIEDYESLIRKLHTLLNPNGILIYSIEHPVVTARKDMRNWWKNENGERLHWALDHYREEGKREQHWYVDGVIKYHRTLQTLVNGLIGHGFMLERMLEPLSTKEGLNLMPDLKNEERRPSFLIIKSRKTD